MWGPMSRKKITATWGVLQSTVSLSNPKESYSLGKSTNWRSLQMHFALQIVVHVYPTIPVGHYMLLL